MRRGILVAAALMASVCSTGAGAQRTPSVIVRAYTAALWKSVPTVEFDGKSALGYIGSVFNIPDTSPTLFARFAFRISTIQNSQTNMLVAEANDNDTGNDYVMGIFFNDNGSRNGLHVTFFAACPDPSGNSYFYAESQESIARDGTWQFITMDAVSDGAHTPTVRMLLGMTELTTPVVESGHRCVFDWRNVKAWSVGGDYTKKIAANAYYEGDLAELYVDMTGVLTVADVEDFVAYSANGLELQSQPLYLDCKKPTLNIPQICLRGNAGFFPQGPVSTPAYEAGYTFSLNEGGTITTGKSSPCVARRSGAGCYPNRAPWPPVQ